MKDLKFSKVFIIAITLMLVSALSGALIVCLNMFTEPKILENERKLEQEKLQEIYADAKFTKLEYSDDSILSIYEASMENDVLGYVYKVSGKNAYGKIVLLVGVNRDGKTKQIVFIENSESYAKDVDKHLTTNYQNKNLSKDDITNIDVKCGATYGAKLVKELVTKAIDHFHDNYLEGGE